MKGETKEKVKKELRELGYIAGSIILVLTIIGVIVKFSLEQGWLK